MFKDTCSECGQIIGATNPQQLGFVQAVHLHDDHNEDFEELAEHARIMIETAEEELENSRMGPLEQMVSDMGGVFGGVVGDIVVGSQEDRFETDSEEEAQFDFETEAEIEAEEEATFEFEEER